MFEWDQTLEEVNMYIELPKGVPTKLFRCTICWTELHCHANLSESNHSIPSLLS